MTVTMKSLARCFTLCLYGCLISSRVLRTSALTQIHVMMKTLKTAVLVMYRSSTSHDVMRCASVTPDLYFILVKDHFVSCEHDIQV